MLNATFQNCLALDNLLASEGGVCGKFNLSNFCLQMDDEGKVIEETTDKMRKISHIPVQTWKDWNHGELFGGCFSTFGGIQNPHKCYVFYFRGLSGFLLLGPPDCKVCLQPH
jgi:hypothetical protein